MTKRPTVVVDDRTPCITAGCGVLLDPGQLCLFHGTPGKEPMPKVVKPRRHEWTYAQALPAMARRCTICGTRQRARDRALKVKSKRAGVVVWEIVTTIPNNGHPITIIGPAGPCPGPQKRRAT